MRNHLPAKPGAASGHSGHSGQVFVLVWGVSHGSKTRVKGMGEGPLWQRFNICYWVGGLAIRFMVLPGASVI